MARTRNIKPGFFRNEELATIEPLGRILFAGLWTIADRDGRLEDRPKRIKLDTLPYDDCDVDALLDALAEKKFIVRYIVGSNRYIEIVNFAKHQRFSGSETSEGFPASNDAGAHFSAHNAQDVSRNSQQVAKPAQGISNDAPKIQNETKNAAKDFPAAEDEKGVEVNNDAGAHFSAHNAQQSAPKSCSLYLESCSLNLDKRAAAVRGRPREEVNNNITDRGKAVIDLFQDSIHPVANMVERDSLLDLMADYGYEWVEYSIREAARSGGRTVKYIGSILTRWRNSGSERPWEESRKDVRRRGSGEGNSESASYEARFADYDEADRNQVYPWEVQSDGGGDRGEQGRDPPHRGGAG